MRIVLAVFFVGIVAVHCIPQLGQSGPGANGKKGRIPCTKWTNVESCTCTDGAEYSTKEDLNLNCKPTDNPIETCICVDGTPWDKPSNDKSSEEESSEDQSSEESE